MDAALLPLAYASVYGVLELAYIKATAAFYGRNVRAVQGSDMEVDLVAATLAYVVLFGTVYYLVVRPVFRATSRQSLPPLKEVLATAAVTGLAIYGIYNLTNKATFKRYGTAVAIVDTAWGVAAICTVAGACYALKSSALSAAV